MSLQILDSLVGSASATFVSLSANKIHGTVIDWTTLVRGYSIEPSLIATFANGELYAYTYTTNVGSLTYYRFIASNGSLDAFFSYYSNGNLANLVAQKAIVL